MEGTSINEKNDINAPWYMTTIIVMFMCGTLLFVYSESFVINVPNVYWWPQEGITIVESFNPIKGDVIKIATIVAIVLFLFSLFQRKIKIKRISIYVPVAIYSFFVLLSGLNGLVNGYQDLSPLSTGEGTLVLLSYMIFLFIIINTINTKFDIKIIIISVGILTIILSIIGIFQIFGMDIFQSHLIQKIIIPPDIANNDLIPHYESGSNKIYSLHPLTSISKMTMTHHGYVSALLALIVPIFLTLFLFEKNKKMKIFSFIVFAFAFINQFNAVTSGSIISISLTVLLIILCLIIKKRKNIKKEIFSVTIIIILCFIFVPSQFMSEISGMVNNTPSSSTEMKKEEVFDYIKTTNKYIEFSVNEQIYELSFDGSSVLLKNQQNGKKKKGDKITIHINDSVVSINKTKESKTPRVVLSIDAGKAWEFVYKDKSYKYINEFGNYTSIQPAKAYLFKDKPELFNGRGYIWSRTLPLIKENIIYGKGAGTFPYTFPHNDYVAKFNFFQFDVNISNPHNSFLGIAIDNGLISLLAYIALLVIYLVQSIKTFFCNRFNSFLVYVGFGIFVGVCGYLVNLVVLDSSTSISPMFYGLLSIGIVINYKYNIKNKTLK